MRYEDHGNYRESAKGEHSCDGVLKPSLSSVIQFEVQKAVFSKSREDLPADYDFYMKLLDKSYYVEASVPWYKTFIAKTFGSVVLRRL